MLILIFKWFPILLLATILINLLLPLIILYGLFSITMYIIKSKKIELTNKINDNAQLNSNSLAYNRFYNVK